MKRSRNVNGAAVRAIREAHGHGASKFATAASMASPSLCNVEAGRRQPSEAATVRIATTLGVEVDAITYPIETAGTTTRRINGATVRVLRDALQITRTDFALRIDISLAYLMNVEAGRKQPAAAVMRRIADELGVPLAAVTYPVLAEAEKTTSRKAKVA